MLRTPRRLRVPAHHDTSAALRGIYPFLAEGGLGAEGVFVGQDLYSRGSFAFDPWVLYQHGVITAPNVVLAGIVGAGKSALAKSLYTRSLAFGRRVYVPGHPKGEHTAIDLALQSAAAAAAVPVLPSVVDRILHPDTNADARLGEDGRQVGHVLRRLVAGDLRGLFDGPSTVRFDPTAPMVSLDLSRVANNTTLLSVLMSCASAWMESALSDPDGGPRWVVYDEAWRLMSHPALLRRMDAQWRLARHYGIANLLIFHKLTDLDTVGDRGSAMHALAASLLANAETRIIYRQETDQLGSTATTLGLTGTERQLLPTLGTGQGLWKIQGRSFVAQHQLHPDEHTLFDTTGQMRRKGRGFTPTEGSLAGNSDEPSGVEV